MGIRQKHRIDQPPALETVLSWCNQFEDALLLCSHSGKTGQQDDYGAYDLIAAAGTIESIPSGADAFHSLRSSHDRTGDWLFGHLGYDLKQEIHGLRSPHRDRIGFPPIRFFRPRFVLTVNGPEAVLHTTEVEPEEEVRSALQQLSYAVVPPMRISGVKPMIQHRTDRSSYLEKASRLIDHIQQGDIYEVNLCVESFAENCTIEPQSTYLRLQETSPMPFSAFYKSGNKYLLCASPERYLAKRGTKLISQPIKGTVRRGKDPEEDERLSAALHSNPKERSENIMITDLVRNDLSRVAARGSVEVESLLELKTYPRIHQLVSTITAQLSPKNHWSEALRHSFPMGSMTGAPKVRAMQLIDQFEDCSRGLYSGCVGYIDPKGDFDFNVVIRSIQYDASSGYLSMMAGSALTIGCDPEKEYEECKLKSETMLRALE
jgi:para-aminobenzoate synthetase component I